MNKEFFNNNVEFYSEEYRDYFLKPWESRLVAVVSGTNVLDVACGGGRITVPLLRRGYDVTGTDFVSDFEQKIQRHEQEFNGEFKFYSADMTALPFPDNQFDSVVCVNSLVYMPDKDKTQKAISEMSRVLKPNGGLYLTTWNILHPYWGTSVLLNYLTRRGKRFGETSPILRTDGRVNNSQTRMYVATMSELKETCREAGMDAYIMTGSQFAGSNGFISRFHPILVVIGRKRK